MMRKWKWFLDGGKGLVVVLLALTLAIFLATPSQAQMLMNGAGATFPYPIYSKWFDLYTKVDRSVRFNYQSIGSGGGIRQISQQTVDFGASDGPMSLQDMQSARGGEIFHIPTVMGAVVVTYNSPGIGKGLKFTGAILSDIFFGKITKWNDPKIASLNPGIKLPGSDMIVVHRSDGSGTTYIWSDYLSSVSKEWETRVGRGTSVNWPVGLGGKGNEGVAGQVKNTPGAVGYVELAYAVQNSLPYGFIQNREGKFVEPTLESTSAAAAGAAKNMPADFRVSLVNPPGQDAYSVAGFTWLLVYKNQQDEVRGKALVNFLWWSIHQGQKYAPDLLYAPLPSQVVRMVEKKTQEISYRGKPLLVSR